MTFVL